MSSDQVLYMEPHKPPVMDADQPSPSFQESVMTRSDCVLDQPGTPTVESDFLADRLESDSSERHLLVLDTRSGAEYAALHVCHSVHVTVPGLIQKRLSKGMSSPVCVIPVNASTAAMRNRLQNAADSVDVVVVCSPVTHNRSNEHNTMAYMSNSIARLLVHRFNKMGSTAYLLQDDLQCFSARYPYLCASSSNPSSACRCTSAETSASANSFVSVPLGPSTTTSKANRPNNLCLRVLPSLDQLSLNDTHSHTTMLLNPAPHDNGGLGAAQSRHLLSASSSSSCTSDVFSDSHQGSSAVVSRTTSNGSALSSPPAPITQLRNNTLREPHLCPPRCKYTAPCQQSLSVDGAYETSASTSNLQQVRRKNNNEPATGPVRLRSPGFKETNLNRRLSTSAPIASSSALAETQFRADSCWVNYEKYNGAINGFPVPITSNLYLGNAHNSTDRHVLDKYNIRYIINVTPDLPNKFIDDDDFHYLQVPVTDHWSQSLVPSYLQECVDFIEEARAAGRNVLVHCLAGISRSVTITVAYMMKMYSMSLDDAYDWVKLRKGNIAPNFNFMGQLLDLERQMRAGSGSPDSGHASCDEPNDSQQRSVDRMQLDDNMTPTPAFSAAAHIKLTQPPAGRKRLHQDNNNNNNNNNNSNSNSNSGSASKSPPTPVSNGQAAEPAAAAATTGSSEAK